MQKTISLVSSTLVVLYKFFEWQIIEILTPFLLPLLWLLVFGFFFAITVRTVINLLKNKDWKPFVIQTVTIILWLFFPFTQVVLDIDFKINKSDREEVARKVENGTLKPNVSYNPSLIHLPKEYDQLSKGSGEIVLEKNGDNYSILFITFRGILDNFSGIVYSPNSQRLARSDFGGDLKEIEKIDGNWYWLGSY
ncbi:hypothetical protein PB1_10699 [Bacillus methanolicus PB1]|uniref:Uncharacterized protein n=1 Tax=Bacillus methanolicus PB1 TaxID=997296 RepID=I3DUV7_BACMT|nr:hypothetical protein [Bacillus methanolicus]EIJ78028.1 hypothetical protein PB1_10699 [Bacillus methanolicus PB1]